MGFFKNFTVNGSFEVNRLYVKDTSIRIGNVDPSYNHSGSVIISQGGNAVNLTSINSVLIGYNVGAGMNSDKISSNSVFISCNPNAMGSTYTYGSSIGYDNVIIGNKISLGVSFNDSTSKLSGNGARCVLLGYSSGGCFSGNDITALGYGTYSNNYNNVTIIGYNARGTAADSVVLGNTSITNFKSTVTTISSLSDVNDKIDIEDLKDVLGFLKKIKVVTFNKNLRDWYFYEDEENEKLKITFGMCNYDKDSHKKGLKKDTRRHVGFLAQEVYQLLKDEFGSDNYMDLVNIDSYNDKELGITRPVEDRYNIQYSNFIPVIIKGIQELSDKIDNLKLKRDLLLQKLNEKNAK